MESLTIDQKLRPIRYAFLIREGDSAAAQKAVSINTALWGGYYNPIIAATPEKNCRGLLKAFDPDFLINLTCGALPESMISANSDRIIEDVDVFNSTRKNKRSRLLRIGHGMGAIYQRIFEHDLQHGAETSRSAIVSNSHESWSLYTAFQFGCLSIEPDQRFRAAYVASTKAIEIGFNPAMELDYRKYVYPIDATTYGLKRYHGGGAWSSHIIFVGQQDSLVDLLEFWNIRATGREVWFVADSNYRNHIESIKSMVKSGKYTRGNFENRTELHKSPSVTSEQFKEIIEWFPSLAIGPIPSVDRSPRFGEVAEYYVGDIHVSKLEGAAERSHAIFHDGRLTPVKQVAPPFLSGDTQWGEQNWAIEFSVSATDSIEWMCQIPDAPGMQDLARRSILAGDREKIRIRDEHYIAYCNNLNGDLQIFPPRTSKVFAKLFGDISGLSVDQSTPGKFAERIIHKMGSLRFDCKVFKIRGVRDIIAKLSNGRSLTQAEMQNMYFRGSDKHGNNWREELYDGLSIRNEWNAKKFSEAFRVLLRKNVIRPGYTLRCESCTRRDWYHVSDFSEEFKCRYCFTVQSVDFAACNEWEFKADGLFQINNSAEGSVSAILALWRFDELSLPYRGRYLTGITLRDSKGTEVNEIDFCYLTLGFQQRYEIVLGEAKSYLDFGRDQVFRLAELADRLNPFSFLAFSTLKEKLSDSEREIFRELVQSGRKVILLTREELDPCDLHKRFESPPHKYPHDLKQLSENTLALNLA